MGAILRKYGAAAQIDGIPLITRGAVDFKANPTLAAGDVTISKDGGAFASIEGAGTFGDFVAVAPAAGTSVQVKPDSDALTCKTLIIRFVDQTTPKEWEDQEILVETYGHASAMHPFDLGVAVPKVDVETIKTQAVTCAAGVTILAQVGAAGAPGANNGLPTTNGTKLNQTADLTAAAVDLMWDELLAAHNIKKSAADYLKKGGGGSTVTLFAGTAQAGSSNSITLATSAPAVTNVLQWNLIAITGGQGAGQTRRIISYSDARVATVDRAWVVAPNGTSTYEVMAAAASVFANEGTVVAATSGTIQLATSAPSGDNALNGAMVTITGGPGAGETKILSNYDGATRTADVDSAWSETPTTASTYAVIPAAESAADTGGGVSAPTAAEVAAEVLAEMNATPPKASVASYQAGQAPLQPVVAGRAIAVGADGSVNAGSVTVEGDVTLAAEQPNYAPAKASDIPSADITAIKNKTDNLPSDPADQSLIIDATNALASAIGAIPAAPTPAEVADGLLGRNIAGGSDGGRDVRSALRAERNKVQIVGGTMTVYQEDDATPAWTAAVQTTPGAPISSVDPV